MKHLPSTKGERPAMNGYCEGKVKYDKKGAITAKNRRWKEDHVELRIYPCPCGWWHLTKTRARQRFNRR